MNYLKERVSYLKGLAEGMQISETANEGKLLKAIIDVLDDIALSVDDIEEVQEQLSDQIDNMDEDLSEIERLLFDDDYEDADEFEGEDGGSERDESSGDKSSDEFDCPHCGKKINIREVTLDRDRDVIVCPHCSQDIDIEWDCECNNCEEDSSDK